MKIFHLSLILLFLNILNVSAQCGNFYSLNQQEIDAFAVNHGCTVITGNLSIDDNVTNLDGLSTITTIEGNLTILNSELLTDLSGLQNITSIGGNLSILDCDALTNVDDLSNLTSVGGNLWINNNITLNSLEGLQNITSIGGRLSIFNNDALTQLGGFQNLSEVGDVSIHYNASLINLDELQNLTSIGGSLIILGESLSNLDGLQNITTIGGRLFVGGSPLITHLDAFQNLISIGGLALYYNDNLENIEALQNITSMSGDLDISANPVLQIQGLQNITSIGGRLRISQGPFTNLDDFQNLTSIGGNLEITDNDYLTDLTGLLNVTSVEGGLEIDNNSALNDLDGLQNINGIVSSIIISNNESLETCCPVVFLLAGLQGTAMIYNNLPSCNSIETINEVCDYFFAEIQIQPFFDENANGSFDANEILLYESFVINPSALYTFPYESETAYFYLDEFGEYQISLNEGSPWNLNIPNNTVQINYLDSTFNDTTLHLPLLPLADLTIQNIDLASSITRCNQETNYWLTYTNTGTTTNDGFIELIPDPSVYFVSANPPADSTAGNTLYWFYENLYPTYSNQIQLVYQMPNVEELGIDIDFEANIQTNEGTGVDKALLSSELICAYDPNDKLVTPAGVGPQNYTLFGDTLEYTIRFQNTGNDTAFTVIIKDELNEQLDLNTFRPISSSHNVETQLDLNTNTATFIFNDIYLPDSFVNQTASHGFVKFQIQTNDNLADFTPIENKANIYFDLNPPIVTNTVLNTFTESIPAVFLGKIFLEGAYQGNGLMTNNLFGIIPLTQPFGNAPYYHQGTESISDIPNQMIDWVLVEARTGTPNTGGTPGTVVVESIAGMLLNNGNIVNTDGTTGLRFTNLEAEQDYYFAIRHRNHLDILTANSISADLSMTYDFSTSPEQAFGLQQQKLSNDGQSMLFAGDSNGDGSIQITDYDLWALNSAILNTYSSTDWNLDGTIQVTDYDLWFLNKAKLGVVEIQY